MRTLIRWVSRPVASAPKFKSRTHRQGPSCSSAKGLTLADATMWGVRDRQASWVWRSDVCHGFPVVPLSSL